MKNSYITINAQYGKVHVGNREFTNVSGLQQWMVGAEGWKETLTEFTLPLYCWVETGLKSNSTIYLQEVMPEQKERFVTIRFATKERNFIRIVSDYADEQ